MEQVKEINTLVTKLIYLAQKAHDLRVYSNKRNMPSVDINYDITSQGNKITFRIMSKGYASLNLKLYEKLFIPECYQNLCRQGISDSWWTISIFYDSLAPERLDIYQLYNKSRIFDRKYMPAVVFGSFIKVTGLQLWLPNPLKEYVGHEPMPERLYNEDTVYSWGWPTYQVWPGYPDSKTNQQIKIILEKFTKTLEEEINARLSSST